MEAIKQLADEAGMEVPQETPEQRQRAEQAASLYEVMDRAASWFEEQLSGLSGGGAREYLAKRGLSRETVKGFRLGFSPPSKTALKAALMASGIAEQQLIDAGLLIQVDDKDSYDRFRGRVMFPINDHKGRVIAFGGRILDDGQPKYLNSPDTPLFDKGRQLYNFDKAAPPARKLGQLFVVEGYMDVIGLAQAGITTAVAPLGTALTEDQIKLLWRLVPEPVLCFDGDSAGTKAALRGAMRALPVLEPGKSLRFISLPEGEDPDSLVRKKGSSAFTSLVDQARNLIDQLWQAEVSGQDLSTPERRALLKSRLVEIARAVANPTVKRLYETELLSRFDGLFGRQPGQKRGYYGKQASLPTGKIAINASQSLAADQGYEAMVHALLLTAIRHPALLDQGLDILAHLPVALTETSAVRDAILDTAAENHQQISPFGLDTGLDTAAIETTLNKRGLLETVRLWGERDRMRLTFSKPETPLEQAERSFIMIGAWLIQLTAIETDLKMLTAEFTSHEQPDAELEVILDRRLNLLHERQRIKTEMGDYARGNSEA